MSTQNAGGGGNQSAHGGEPSTSVGVGPANDHERCSQRASGGSGGSQLTRSLEDTNSDAPSQATDAGKPGCGGEQSAPLAADSLMTTATRGPQDTHSHQAGATATGLGAPETGGNQNPGDLAPTR